ncbi:MAG TPA: VOC family protein [Thermoleophilaceae bacterium]|jgi:predicted enzyme related to lactoylglutathione lyase
MSERDAYQHGVPCWVETLQPDPEAATRFYGELFGWEFTDPASMPGDPPGQYFVARLRGSDVAGIGSQPAEYTPPVPAWITHVSVDSADEAAEKTRGAGGQVVVDPFDALPAGRLAVLTDPAGALFCAWEPRIRKGAQRVNEPGAWAMSTLNTRDSEDAKKFYAAVFGWETDTFQMGESEMTLWRVPGYVGGEPGQPVSREVVGAMAPIAGDDEAPQWSVNFWIDDADAAADNTGRLGGKVVVPPHDLPGFRNAVLADPQGAVFSVSELRPAG